MVLGPTQLSASLLEATHTATSLPWWASIPATTLAVRAALLPLSIKAKSASANLVLLDAAVAKSRAISQAVDPVVAKQLGRMRLVHMVYTLLRQRHGTPPSLRWYWINAAVQVGGASSFEYQLLTNCWSRGYL
jgi:membrane protein insertase Oxa1/YidC/SpoIIIJ